MLKLIKRLGFKLGSSIKRSARIYGSCKELASQTGDPRAINQALMQCDRLYSLFRDEETPESTNVIPFKRENFYD